MLEKYRSGHNEHDWKSCCRDERHAGSNPAFSATSEQSSLCSVFLCKKNIPSLPCSSSSAKKHSFASDKKHSLIPRSVFYLRSLTTFLRFYLWGKFFSFPQSHRFLLRIYAGGFKRAASRRLWRIKRCCPGVIGGLLEQISCSPPLSALLFCNRLL